MQVNGVSHHGIVDQRDPEPHRISAAPVRHLKSLIPLNDR